MSMDAPQRYRRASRLAVAKTTPDDYSGGRKPRQQADSRDDDSGKYTQQGSRALPAGKKEIRREGGVAAASG
jgi:hypothetical protein